MLVELFKMSDENWGIYDIQANRVAEVPSSQLQLFQTLKFRLIIAVAFYSLLTVFGNVSIWLRIGGTALFYGLITFYYYRRALPNLKWINYTQLTLPQQQAVTRFFQSEKVLMRIGFSILVSFLAGFAFYSQHQTQTELSLEKIVLALLAISMLIEALRQVLLLSILKRARG